MITVLITFFIVVLLALVVFLAVMLRLYTKRDESELTTHAEAHERLYAKLLRLEKEMLYSIMRYLHTVTVRLVTLWVRFVKYGTMKIKEKFPHLTHLFAERIPVKHVDEVEASAFIAQVRESKPKRVVRPRKVVETVSEEVVH
jgi:hypothetical protein